MVRNEESEVCEEDGVRLEEQGKGLFAKTSSRQRMTAVEGLAWDAEDWRVFSRRYEEKSMAGGS